MARRGLGAAMALALLALLCGSASAQGACMEQALKAHNELRARHGAGPLVWDNALEQRERDWVTRLANSGCSMQHSPGGMENLAWVSKDLDNACKLAVDGWYAEKAWYQFDPSTPIQATNNWARRSAPFRIMTGHFTQVVWAAATKVGCYAAYGSCGVVVGCAYDAGNNMSNEQQYLTNVKPELPNAVASGTGNCPTDILATLNAQRKVYGAAPLNWDEGLAAGAKITAFDQVARFQCTQMWISEAMTTVYSIPLPEDRKDVCVHAANMWFGERKNIISQRPNGQDTPSSWLSRSAFPLVAHRDMTKVGCYVHRGPLDCAVVACKFAGAAMSDESISSKVMMQPTSNVVAPATKAAVQDKDAQCKSQGYLCTNNGQRSSNGGPWELVSEACPETCAAEAAKVAQNWIAQAANLGATTSDNVFSGVISTNTPTPAPTPTPNPGRLTRVQAYIRTAFEKFDHEEDLSGAKQECENLSGGAGSCEEADGVMYPKCRDGFTSNASNWAQCSRQNTASNRRMKL